MIPETGIFSSGNTVAIREVNLRVNCFGQLDSLVRIR